ncbi:MAG: methyltransferase [Clostridia bacterium]
MLHDNEKLEDLEYEGLKIIQDKDGYCFTSDSVLLANLVNIKKSDNVVELGSGSGVISILLSAKYNANKIVGVEIQERLADMAIRSIEYNNLSENIEIINKPMQGIEKELGNNWDVVITNPPYAKQIVKKDSYTEDEICKSEIMVTLDDVVITASKLLKFGGNFYMINKANRLIDAICSMRENNLEPKKIYFIQPKLSKDIDTFIIVGKKGGKSSILLPKPIIIYDEDGNYTPLLRRMYNK